MIFPVQCNLIIKKLSRFLYYHLISLVEQVGSFKQYEFDKTVYTIVILTSIPRDGSMNFSCAISDMNPINEHGQILNVYPHRLLFLCPRLTMKKPHRQLNTG
ncbi:MAG: hypothetical protein RL637_1040 [Pseudomonadota bacterium]|jgi:hypothetical protein